MGLDRPWRSDYDVDDALALLHHGLADETVVVSQAHSLIRAMEALEREPLEFEAFIYEGGGHAIFALRGAIPRAVDFLRQALGLPTHSAAH